MLTKKQTWCATNDLPAGQTYLYDNRLLKRPLETAATSMTASTSEATKKKAPSPRRST